MRSEAINCDTCQKPKLEANKWIMGWRSEHGFALGDWITGFEYELSRRQVHHFCGETCALKYQSKFLRRDLQPVVDLEA